MARIAIITGGAQGIGRGTVHYLAERGWRVVALDTDADALADLTQSLPGDALLTLRCDVAREGPVRTAFRRIQAWQARTFPNEAPGIDLLVNNAGIADPCSGPIERLELKQWRAWIDASLTAAFLCSRAAIPLLRPRRGSIVNIGSTRALQSEPNSEAYAAAKGGLTAFTHALAISLGPDIRVNAVQPGWIETGPWQKPSARRAAHHSEADRAQHPVGRVGEPRDIAATIAWLASDDAGFVTGQALVVDGGMTRRMIYAG